MPPWPDEGRLARVTDGEWEGCLALVMDERDSTGDLFLIYVASDRDDDYRHTDFLAAMDASGYFSLGLDWIEAREADRLESEFFGMRQHYREQAAYRSLSWWRRATTRQCRCG